MPVLCYLTLVMMTGVQNETMNDAIKEMMDRIKKGRPLNPVDMNARVSRHFYLRSTASSTGYFLM